MRIYKTAGALCLIAASCAISTLAGPAAGGLYFSQSLSVAANPLGGIADSRVFGRLPLFGRTGILWDGTKLDAGIQNEWTPADDFAGLYCTIDPLSILSIFARAGFYGMYSGLGWGYFPLDSTAAPIDDASLRRRGPIDATGWWCTVAPTLQVKVRRIAALNTVTVNWLWLRTEGYFLDMRTNLPHKSHDINVLDDAYVLYEIMDNIMLGLTWHLAYVRGTQASTQQLGVILAGNKLRWPVRETFFGLVGGMYLWDRTYRYQPYGGLVVGVEIRASRYARAVD